MGLSTEDKLGSEGLGTANLGRASLSQDLITFSPTSIPDLEIWFDASDVSTITHSSNSVSQWDDKSGNGRHLTQATSSKQPTTGSATINGLNVLSFDGTDDSMSCSYGGEIAKPQTIFMVIQGQSGVTRTVIDGLADPKRINVFMDTTYNMYAGLSLNSGVGTDGSTTHQFTCIYKSDDTGDFRINGVSEATGSIGPQTGSLGMLVAESIAGANNYQALYAEILMYSRELSATEISNVETYLQSKNKWGVS